MKRISLIIYIIVSCAATVAADNIHIDTLNNNEWDYELNCGINIGGASPLSIPREIRSIDSYNPRFNGEIGGEIIRWLNKYSHWGLSVGFIIESKSMHTGATVKSYQTEVSYDDNSKVSGYWTGFVNTKYNTTLITMPVLANYRLDSKWKFRAGFYLSYAIHRDFSGYVTDGYLRQNTPVGQKILFTEGKRGTYDFSDNLRRLQPGLQIGASWMNKKHLCINADMAFGMSDIFESSFKTVTFNMYPIYLKLGWSYKF